MYSGTPYNLKKTNEWKLTNRVEKSQIEDTSLPKTDKTSGKIDVGNLDPDMVFIDNLPRKGPKLSFG